MYNRGHSSLSTLPCFFFVSAQDFLVYILCLLLWSSSHCCCLRILRCGEMYQLTRCNNNNNNNDHFYWVMTICDIWVFIAVFITILQGTILTLLQTPYLYPERDAIYLRPHSQYASGTKVWIYASQSQKVYSFTTLEFTKQLNPLFQLNPTTFWFVDSHQFCRWQNWASERKSDLLLTYSWKTAGFAFYSRSSF